MTTQTCFIEPLDVLFLRGNKLFGDPGSHGESLVPPWPSVAAGAIRSRILVDDRVDLAAFANGEVRHPAIGTPSQPGSFAVTAFHLARRFVDGRIELLIAPPADLVISESDGRPTVRRLHPVTLAAGLSTSTNLPLVPVSAEQQRGKSASGYWLTEAGWRRYLAGQLPSAGDLLKASQLWQIDQRVGVGLDARTRRAADGKLFSAQAVSMIKAEHGAGFDAGFVAVVSGAPLPQGGMLRLGGDGRAAALHTPTQPVAMPEVDYAAIARSRRCRLVLTTPGIFLEGWRPPGIDTQGNVALHGVRGKLVCAAVPRFETISGWDLSRHAPKIAKRVAPAGSVYWLDQVDAAPDAFEKLVACGLWADPCEDPIRRAEGFNRIAIAIC
jgi:CRISPR-associated protein Cmr3